MRYEELLQIPPYSLPMEKKRKILTKRLIELTELHRTKCPEYRQILDCIGYDKESISTYEDLPFIPVRLFKERSLKSVMPEEVIKTMTSSGTSGQSVSKIYLDRTTSFNQQKTMVKIVSDFTGAERMPMIIIDSPSVIKDRKMFSARGAGILGFSMFGSKKIYALNEDMSLDVAGIRSFLQEHAGERIFLFGFTFIIWQHFYKELIRLKKETDESFDFSDAVLIHGGGWKKLLSEAVDTAEFRRCLQEICKITKIHDYYGMVEQTGCIYMQCECGHLHASIFSDIIIRNPADFSVCNIGERGIIQAVSSIPESYPGHSLLTEDEGVILGEDDCPCGRKGKYFKIYGRLKAAEIRGCSDTYANDYTMLSERTESVQNRNDEADLLSKITFLIGNTNILSALPDIAPKVPFDEEILSFLGDLSKKLLSDSHARMFSDIVSLGFWLRPASLRKMKEQYIQDNSSRMLIGRGVVFHIAPSNVAVNYAYSLFTGLLMGNANIARLPSRDFDQINVINTAITETLEQYPNLMPYISLIRYEHNKDITDLLSEACDVRVIWGGNATISEIRRSHLPPKTTEITFADRYSMAMIDSDDYMHISDKKHVAADFYNDTYLSDQNACTSPRVIIWTGGKIAEAKEIFWQQLHALVKEKYSYQAIHGVDKLSLACLAVTSNDLKRESYQFEISAKTDNLIYRIQTNRLSATLMDYKGNSGFFYEYDCHDVFDLKKICDNVYCQTIGISGPPQFLLPLIKSGIRGIDRIVPIGHTMDFNMDWDGYNLCERLTRAVTIK